MSPLDDVTEHGAVGVSEHGAVVAVEHGAAVAVEHGAGVSEYSAAVSGYGAVAVTVSMVQLYK